MKSRSLVLGLAACLIIGALLLLVARRREPAPAGPVAPVGESAVVKETKGGNAAPAPSPTEPEDRVEPQAPPADDKPREDILAEIEQLSVTYDAKELPRIEPYLLHPDAEVRKAAMNGMIVLGDSTAAPLLRKAAEKAPTPQEAVALTEAADFMELPEGSFVPKNRAKPGARVPLDAKPAERKAPPGRPGG